MKGIGKVLGRKGYTTIYRSMRDKNGYLELLIVRDFTGRR